ncbi:MAG: hypothetical protein ABR878_16030 [Roseiarcus sp.]
MATIAEAVIGPMLGDVIVDGLDLLVDRVDLLNQRRQRLAHAVGNDDLAVLVAAVGEQALEPIGVLRPLRRHDPDLRQMTAQRIEHRNAIARQKFARPMAHQLGLVVDAANRREAHVRPPDRLARSAAASTASFLLRRT